MFERYTDRARRVVVLAQEEARLLHHNYIGTEHLLAALVREGEGVAAIVLAEFGLTIDGVRNQIITIIGEGRGPEPEVHIAFTPRVKKVLELSLREALQLGHNYIGTEHLLLGLEREAEGVGAQILKLYQIDPTAVRGRVLDILGHYLGAERIRREVKIEELARGEIVDIDDGLRLLLEHKRFTDQWQARMADHKLRDLVSQSVGLGNSLVLMRCWRSRRTSTRS